MPVLGGAPDEGGMLLVAVSDGEAVARVDADLLDLLARAGGDDPDLPVLWIGGHGAAPQESPGPTSSRMRRGTQPWIAGWRCGRAAKSPDLVEHLEHLIREDGELRRVVVARDDGLVSLVILEVGLRHPAGVAALGRAPEQLGELLVAVPDADHVAGVRREVADVVARPRLDDPHLVRRSLHPAIVVRFWARRSRRPSGGVTMRYHGRPMTENRHIRVRFAPSPTGYLHLGSARTGLYNYIFARRHEGTFILRIEDTDLSRSTDEAIVQIIESMKEMGLHWDEGPGVPGPHGPYRQTERDGIYHEHVARLLESGHLYPCFCTPEELEAERDGGAGGGPGLGVLGQVPGAGAGRGPAPPGGRRTVHAARACARRPHRLPRHPARRRRLRERHHRRLHRAALGRHRHLQPRRRGRRRHHGDHPRHPR